MMSAPELDRILASLLEPDLSVANSRRQNRSQGAMAVAIKVHEANARHGAQRRAAIEANL